MVQNPPLILVNLPVQEVSAGKHKRKHKQGPCDLSIHVLQLWLTLPLTIMDVDNPLSSLFSTTQKYSGLTYNKESRRCGSCK